MTPILPGSTIGILGSGQLGRMLAMAARRLGYAVHVFSPDAPSSPAGQVADVEISAAYTDEMSLAKFAQDVDVVTLEFENIPVSALKALETQVPVYPQPHVLYITQHRLREKTFLVDAGMPVAPFSAIHSGEDLEDALEELDFPLVLKTAGFGYDGKGQVKVTTAEEARAAYRNLGTADCILEQFIDLEREISIIAARNRTGFAAYRPVENRHRNHILDLTLAPAALPAELEQQAMNITRAIMELLDMRGVLCVEFFITKQGKLLVNELAPRPHNSGHYTIEAAYCSQFEQQLRAVCGLPMGSTELRQPAAMANLLGDAWHQGEPNWTACLAESSAFLHLYGKREARPGRKMGHITTLGGDAESAAALALQMRERL
jgi:5-(carboxyamino)imidazole ribonucleotide synthase